VTRIDTLMKGPWDSLYLVATIVGPGAVGIALSLMIEVVARRKRRRRVLTR
jgi:hypothetical protein